MSILPSNRPLSVPIRPDLFKRPVRWVGCDLDGTLVDSQGRVSARARRAICLLEQSGIGFSIITGRTAADISLFLEAANGRTPYITSGGAYIYDPRCQQVVHHAPLSAAAARLVVEEARKIPVDIVFEFPDRIVIEIEGYTLEQVFLSGGAPVVRCQDLLVEAEKLPDKIELYAGLEGRQIIGELADHLLSLPEPLGITYTGKGLVLEVNRQGVSKGAALRWLSEYVQAPLDQFLVIGDDHNDLSMFAEAGITVAMGNALPEVQEAAKLVAPTNNEDGAAWVIESLLAAREGVKNFGS